MSWRPPDDLYEQLRVIAFHTRRSLNDLVTEAVGYWIEREGKAAAVKAQRQKGRTP